jgi:hypothetical protein
MKDRDQRRPDWLEDRCGSQSQGADTTDPLRRGSGQPGYAQADAQGV